MLDYILVRDRGRRVRAARVERLDEHPNDRGPTVFGSDHHPLLARLELDPEGVADMSDLFSAGLPWWGWALMVLGLIALVSVLGALFLPDWKEPDYTLGQTPSPAAEQFVEHGRRVPQQSRCIAAARSSCSRTATGSIPRCSRRFARPGTRSTSRSTSSSPTRSAAQFMDAFMERARAGVEVRVLVDGFGSFKLRKRHRDELTPGGSEGRAIPAASA